MRFLYSVKGCSKCAKRSNCSKKNSPENLVKDKREFEHVNRSTVRHGMRPYKLISFCRDFIPEEKGQPKKSQKMIELTKEALQKAMISHDKLTIVDVWAPWCRPCKVISPIIEEVAKDYPQVNVIKVNIEENPEYGKEHNIMGIPTLLFLKDNKEIDRIVGAVSSKIIEKKIEELLR